MNAMPAIRSFHVTLFALITALATASFADTRAATGAASDNEDIALSLATLLRAARAVISEQQDNINDAEIGDKGLGPEVVIRVAKENFARAVGTSIDAIDPLSRKGRLLAAELQAIRTVMTEAQATINEKGVGLKGFLPAVFARLVAHEFTANSGDRALLKLTAPRNYVRNRANRPDRWENEVIETLFRAPDRAVGRHHVENTTFDDRRAFRLILPEYYTESCLACHGGPAGETDITGGQKEGGVLGELGGAISVVIFN